MCRTLTISVSVPVGLLRRNLVVRVPEGNGVGKEFVSYWESQTVRGMTCDPSITTQKEVERLIWT